jgi:hypothetical protein
MTRHRPLAALGLLLAALTAAVHLWQHPGLWRGPISAAESARYLAAVERLPLATEERAATLDAVRAFIAGDDGQSFQMLNLMRYYPELRPIAGFDTGFSGTPLASNARYEDQVMPMLFGVGGYPSYAGAASNTNILGKAAELDDWSRVLLVRYPSRRAFLDLLSHPDYAPIAPYKLQALRVVLTPTRPEMVVPPLSLLVGALSLIVFLAFGWWRAARRSIPAAGVR